MHLDLSGIAGRVREFMRRSLEGGEREEPFNELALQLYSAQRRSNSPFAKLCEARGIEGVEKWQDIPAVPTAAFKELELTSLPEEARKAVFFSSGTTRQERSRHFHSAESLALYEESLWLWFRRLFGNDEIIRRVFLTPSAKEAPHSSLAHMFAIIAERCGDEARFVGRVAEDGGWELDLKRATEVFGTGEGSMAIFGTAFLFVNLLDELERRGVKMKLPDGSWVLETGGYKGRTREIPKEELHHMLRERLGVSKIFGEYGMSELSSQAYAARDELFRFPPWARARMISPATGKEVKEGERGLIRVYDLANVWSVMAVQTEDIGIKVGDAFRLVGRAAQAEARGCSLMTL